MAENTNLDIEQLATLLFYIENAQLMLPDIAVAEIIPSSFISRASKIL